MPTARVLASIHGSPPSEHHPDHTEDGVGGAACSRACIPISHTTRRVHSLCGSLLPLPCARITGVSYAATRANEFREASLCCALCVQRAPHIGQTLHSSAVGWRVMELAPARTFTYKFAAACGTSPAGSAERVRRVFFTPKGTIFKSVPPI